MTNRCDAELAEILAGQPAQYLPINVIVAERGRILLEPEAAQPFGHIHRSCPGTASLGKHYTPVLQSVQLCERYLHEHPRWRPPRTQPFSGRTEAVSGGWRG